MSLHGSRQIDAIVPGEVLDGKYRVLRVLGAGGMGVVVMAHHIGLDEKVAIKFLLPEMLSNVDAVTRFAREARNAVKIKGEHMARIFDVGTLDSGAPYMVMEFLEGNDLHTCLRQRGTLPFEEAVDCVLQACEVVAEAHAIGIVHRDLKPANLFSVRRPDGRPFIKVLDFGISKVTRLDGSPTNGGMTSTAGLMGSPFYMSPEQMEAPQAVDARTDIWALGVIVHELVTGTLPFPGETLPEVSIKIATRAPVPLRESRPDAPAALQGVVSRCLEKDRERRYRTVGELANALAPFGSRRARASVERIAEIIQPAGLSATAFETLPSSNPPSSPLATQTIAPLGRTTQGKGRGKKLAAAAFGIGCALGGAAAVGFAVARISAQPSTDPNAVRPAAVHGEPSVQAPAGPGEQGSIAVPALPEPSVPVVAVPTRESPPAAVPQKRHAAAHAAVPPATQVTTSSASPPSLSAALPASTTTSAAPPAISHEPTAAPAASKNCDPPYYFDAKNNRVFKKECL